MAAVPNDQIQLIDLLEFNRQLEGMITAGLPLSWQGDDSPSVLSVQAERVASQAALQVAQGRSLAEALKSLPDVSVLYKAGFLGWVLSDRSPVAFEMLTSNVARLQQARKIWFLNFQLGVVALLALVVLAIWLSFGRIDLLYTDSHLQIGPLSRLLESLQAKPLFALVGGAFLLVLWGGALQLIKHRLAKLSLAMTSKQANARRNWIKSKFISLVSSCRGSISEAEEFFDSLVWQSPINCDEVGPPVVGDQSPIARSAYLLWSADKAVDQRLSYRISTLPYVIYFIGSGVVVFSIGLLVFGPLIELLHAAVVPGAF